MTRIFLAAGVAALAIAAPAAAGPGGGHGHGGGGGGDGGGGGGPHAEAPHGGGGGGAQQGGGGPHGGGAPAFVGGGGHGHGGGGGFAPMFARGPGGGGHGHGGGGHAFTAPQRQAFAPQHVQRFQMRQQPHGRSAERQQMHGGGHGQQAQARMAQRQQMHGGREQMRELQRAQQAQNMRGGGQRFQDRMAARQALQANRTAQFENQFAGREQLRGERFANNPVGFGVGGCPPGLANKGCMPPGLARNGLGQMSVGDRLAAIRTLGDARFAPVDFAPQRQILDPFVASALVGVPLATAQSFGTFQPFPADLSYLYPSTPNYYYEYGNGYAYQIDRSNNLIDALIPLLAGGYLPGSYLPTSYMNSYVPDYYGLNSFYPSSYEYGYGGGYPNLCNRYANGVVYQVDCATGMVQNVIPTYAGGYGVGQRLPAAYSYY